MGLPSALGPDRHTTVQARVLKNTYRQMLGNLIIQSKQNVIAQLIPELEMHPSENIAGCCTVAELCALREMLGTTSQPNQ